jgi:hypothetical protein
VEAQTVSFVPRSKIKFKNLDTKSNNGGSIVKTLKLFLTAIFLGSLLAGGETFGAPAPGATQTISGGGVTAEVTYLNPKSGDEPRFQVVLDTHSVNLDAYDLKTITVLRDDTGKEHLPKGAENKGSGHHREVSLVFPPVTPEAKRLEMIIKGIAGVNERIFRWELR